LHRNENKIIKKTKIGRIRSQQIRESCGIQPINEWFERRRRRKWEERVTIMDAERLVRSLRDTIPAGRRSPGRQKGRLSDLLPDYNRRNRL
jgi:hypothetical protein